MIPINKYIFYFVSFVVSFTAIAIPIYLVGDVRNSLYLTIIILLDIKFLIYLYLAAIKKLNNLDKNLLIFIFILILGLFMNLINEGNILYPLFKSIISIIYLVYFYNGIKLYGANIFKYGIIFNSIFLIYQYIAHQYLNIPSMFWNISEILDNNAVTVAASLRSSLFDPVINATSYVQYTGYKYAGLSSEPAYFSSIAVLSLFLMNRLSLSIKALLVSAIILSFSWLTLISLIVVFIYRFLNYFFNNFNEKIIFNLTILAYFLGTIIISSLLTSYGGTFHNRFYSIEVFFDYDLMHQFFGYGSYNIYIPEISEHYDLKDSASTQGLIASLLTELGIFGILLYFILVISFSKNIEKKEVVLLFLLTNSTVGFLTLWPYMIYFIALIYIEKPSHEKKQSFSYI